MKKIILGVAAAAATLIAGSAMAQPYGYDGYNSYRGGYDSGSYGRSYSYGYSPDRYAYRDSDRDGIPDRAEWNRDRDHDGRPDQWDRYDNRRDWRHHRHHHHWRYSDRYDRYDRYDDYRRY